MKPIELYLLSGFLGAGKTTLLEQLVEAFAGKQLGIIVNEFGELGLDGLRYRDSEIRLVEINRGSVFCACLKDGFVRTLKAFSRQPIDVLLIENSGMADPSTMPKLLEGLRPYVERPYAYGGNLCLVDGTTFFDYVDVLEPVRRQVLTADALIVNKIDLLDQKTLEELHEALRDLNPTAPMLDTVFAQVPMDFLRSALPGSGAAGPCSNTPYNRPTALTLETAGRTTQERVRQFYEALAPLLIRLKGFVRTEAQWINVQAVGKRLDLGPVTEEEEEILPEDGVRLVVILKPGETMTKEELREIWERL